jgi:hypothetical protein
MSGITIWRITAIQRIPLTLRAYEVLCRLGDDMEGARLSSTRIFGKFLAKWLLEKE